MKKAFTLTELMIALAIVGILAVLLIPNLINNYSKKTMTAALQRNYDAIAGAVKMMMVEDRARLISNTALYKTAGKTVTATAGNFMKKYLKIVKDCGTETGECFASSYKNLNGGSVTLPTKDSVYCGTMPSGAGVCIAPPTSSTVAKVILDVNGVDKPNIAGRDLFTFFIYMDGFCGNRLSGVDDLTICKDNSYSSGCFSRITKNNWVMDY